MPTRIDKVFAGLKPGQARLICFTTAGFPDIDTSMQIINQLPQWGADVVEIGMPFSDASADGGTIRESSRLALEKGINTEQVLELATSFRQTNPDTALILMGYYNPILRYGCKEFVEAATKAGVDGLIIVDLPPEEEEEITCYMDDDLCLVHLITPTTDAERLKVITRQAKGFLYYVSVTGTTGSAVPDLSKVATHLKQLQPSLPVAIGFGISDANQVKDFSQLGQGVVVGSALLKTIGESSDMAEIEKKLVAQIGFYKQALS